MAVSLSIAITQNSQNISNNTSNVTVKVNIKWTYGSFNRTEKSGYLIIDGTKYTFTSTFNKNQSTSGSQTIFSKTVNIPHNSNGTKTLSTSASFTSGVSSGTVTATASKVLTTIPRKSTLTASNGALGIAQTLTVTRQSSDFTHTITYKCGTASGTIVTKSSDTSISWTPPLTLSSQNTAGTSVSITFTITTFNHSTGATIGTNTKTITCTIPASVKPSCSLAVTDSMGYEGIYGNPIKGLSKFKVVVTPTLAHGSPIASYSVYANGATYTSASFTSGVLRSSGALSVSATVKDKRGRTGTATVLKTVLSYTEPVISILTVHRCDEDGAENEQGEFVKVNFTAAVTALNNKNTAVYTLYYKKSTDTEFTEVGLDELEDNYSINSSYIFPADTSNSYDVEFTAADNFKTTKRVTSASTGFALIHHRADGTGLGLGKLGEVENGLDVGLDAVFRNPVYGKVMGLDKLPEIPEGSDVNDYLETGCWAVYGNSKAEKIANLPVKRAGRLEVISATGEGIRVTEWSYIRQRYTPYNSANAVWERDITRSDSNVWTYGEWYRSTLSATASETVYHEQKVLWEGAMYMTEGHTVNLSEAVSKQPHGIVLIFSKYADGAALENNFNSFFVPRLFITEHKGYGNAFTMMDINFGIVSHKYLYINDLYISGHSNNDAVGTGTSGIAYANNKYVLRYVIGV